MLALSGMAALVYQVVWVRQLSLVVGVEVYSITVAVSAFFAGLAAGGAVWGRVADRWRQPLMLYGLLEAGAAVAGVVGTILLAHAAGAFVAVESHAGVLAWALPFLLVGGPAFLMGGTLPVAVRAWGSDDVAGAGGWIYAVNTAGGIAGALLSSFALLPWLGVTRTAVAAAVMNLGAAGLAWAVSKGPGAKAPFVGQQFTGLKAGAPSERTKKSEEFIEGAKEPTQSCIQSKTALWLYGIAGGIALGYEVVWTQAMAQFLSTRVFAFSVVLATYLAGLVIGSWLYARFAGRVRDAWGVFGLLIAAAGVVALLEIAGLNLWQLQIQLAVGRMALSATGSEFARMCAQFFVTAMGVVFVPTVLLGAAFPAALRLAAGSERTGRDVGSVLALNMAGGIAGTLLTGFVLVPALGLVRTLGMLAVAASAVGALAVLTGPHVSKRMQGIVCAVGVVAVCAGIFTPVDRLSRLLLTTRGGGALVFYEEGRGATVAVAQQQARDNVFRRLFIQGVSNSGDAMPSLRYMRLQAMLPLMIHRGEPKSALVIGFGTGITAGAAMKYPGLERRVCVELLPAVVKAGALFPENYGAGRDARMQVRLRDGRQELLRSEERYDLITLEPPPPSAEGVVNLYSTEFYRLASKRLATNGLLAQWLPIAAQNDEDTRALVGSFLDVFPYASLWTTELHEMMLVGSMQPMELDAGEIARRFVVADVSTPLGAVGIASPAALLSTWVTGREGLERYAAGVRAVTDDFPRIEYARWVRPREIVRVLPELLALRTEPPLVGADDALRGEVARQRQSLMDFYAAGLAAYNGDRDGWAAAMERVRATDGDNPYYRWISGERQ
jgi:spermidine synthase